MRTVPTASKKFWCVGLANDSRRLPLLVEMLGRNEDALVDLYCIADDADDGTPVEEKLRNPGFVLLRFLWWRVVLM